MFLHEVSRQRPLVLFLEDIAERPYRIDRMLTTFRHSGVLRAVRGIVLGEVGCAAVQQDAWADPVGARLRGVPQRGGDMRQRSISRPASLRLG